MFDEDWPVDAVAFRFLDENGEDLYPDDQVELLIKEVDWGPLPVDSANDDEDGEDLDAAVDERVQGNMQLVDSDAAWYSSSATQAEDAGAFQFEPDSADHDDRDYRVGGLTYLVQEADNSPTYTDDQLETTAADWGTLHLEAANKLGARQERRKVLDLIFGLVHPLLLLPPELRSRVYAFAESKTFGEHCATLGVGGPTFVSGKRQWHCKHFAPAAEGCEHVAADLSHLYTHWHFFTDHLPKPFRGVGRDEIKARTERHWARATVSFLVRSKMADPERQHMMARWAQREDRTERRWRLQQSRLRL
jgi:hypothetical protein